MKKILILGSSGLIGSHLAAKAVCNYNVIAASRSNYDISGASNAYFDIYDESIDPIIIQQGEFDSVIVTAWDGHQRDKRNDPSINKHCADSIIKYLRLLCDRCRIKQIILCGSVKEYGNISGIITEETKTNINDLSAYGRAKIKLYHDLLSSGICDNITELRFHSVYGYVHGCDQMIGNMLKTVHNGNEFVFSSSCEHTYDFTYVDDVANAALYTVEKQLSGVYNISSNSTLTLIDYVVTAAEACELNTKLLHFGENKEISSFFSSDKFRNATGWSDKVDFRIGIKDMYLHLCEEG